SNLNKKYPDAQIDYVCNRRTKVVMDQNPSITKVYVYERDEYKALSEKSRWQYFKKICRFLKDIRHVKYDVLFDFSLNTSIGFITLLAAIPHRVGFNFKKRGRFLNHKIDLNRGGYENKHMVEYYCELLRKYEVDTPIINMKMHLNPTDIEFSRNFVRDNNIELTKPIVGIAPGGGASWGSQAHLKRWAIKNYAKLADNLIEKQHASIILFGDANEVALCEEMVNLMTHKPILACGKTNIHQFGALAKKCSVMVLNDGGPLHMAVACGAKTVSMFGPVDENVYGPYPRSGHKVIKKDSNDALKYRGFRLNTEDGHNTLNDIYVEDVYKEVLNLL
ncbi:MAG: lipopolysaccharide heptosyltransferase II, partial [Candidatus Omnitrophota bacterium]